MGVGVTVFALRRYTAPVGGGASLAALLPHSPRLFLRRHSTTTSSSSTSSHDLIMVFIEAAGALSFDLLTWLGHGIL